MKPLLIGSRPLAKVLVLANAVLWLTFAVYFIAQSYPWQPHQKLFEEQSPPCIFWGHAFPFDKYMSPFMRATRLIEAPSFYAATPLFWYFDSRHIVADSLYAGVDVGGYYLILVCLLSFAQWYLTGFFIDGLRRRFTPT
jgi:hypothetical protein